MKNLLVVSCLTLLVFLAGCSNNSNPTNPIQTGSMTTGIVTTGAIIQTGAASQTFTINLSDPKHDLSLLLNSGENITITVEQPSVKAMVRVSQIVMPDGTMDGPFGPELKFTATQPGIHNFIISVNQMASEDIFTGSVAVKITGIYSLIK